mgnify:CR=1 FL=1
MSNNSKKVFEISGLEGLDETGARAVNGGTVTFEQWAILGGVTLVAAPAVVSVGNSVLGFFSGLNQKLWP